MASSQHDASRRWIPATLGKSGNLVFGLQKARGHAPWANLLQALVGSDVLNPVRYPGDLYHASELRQQITPQQKTPAKT